MSALQEANFLDRRHRLPGHPHAAASVVSGDLAALPSRGRQREATGGVDRRHLQDGVDDVPQAAPCDERGGSELAAERGGADQRRLDRAPTSGDDGLAAAGAARAGWRNGRREREAGTGKDQASGQIDHSQPICLA